MTEYVLTKIMAGGKGERLWPLTKERTKSAVPFGGGSKLIDPTLSNCIHSGLRQIYVLTQYKSFSLDRHLSEAWSFLPRHLEQYIDNVHAQKRTGEDWYMGTADAVRQNLYHIKNLEKRPGRILILSGDHIYKMDYRLMIEEHRDRKADMTMSLVRKPVDEARGELGVVEVEGNGKVKGFEEKPQIPKKVPGDEKNSYVSMGVYLFETDVLFDVLTQHEGDDFGKEIIPYMHDEGYRVYGHDFGNKNEISDEIFEETEDGERKRIEVKNIPFSDYWVDAGTIKSYYEANMDLVGLKPRFNLYGKWKIYTHQGQLPEAKYVLKNVIDECIISKGCIITGSRIRNSILSPSVMVEKACIEDSILFDKVQAGNGSLIKNAIIDKGCIIPSGIEITPETLHMFDIPDSVVSDGIAVIPKGTKIRKK